MSVSDVTSGNQTSTLEALQEQLSALEKRVGQVEESLPEEKVSLLIFSGELDKVLAAFVIATGAAALGQEVSMFFTFWGLGVLKKKGSLSDKSLFQKMMSVMSPDNTTELPVSKMNYFGVGAKMLRKMMQDRNVDSLEDMIAMAKEMGVVMTACEMSRDVMGISDDELVDGLERGGVAAYLSDSLRSRTNLFI
jgi:peroxiredoxin family protein